MFTNQATTRQGTSTGRNRRLVAMASSVALVVLLSGNVAARPMEFDGASGSSPLVTPRLKVNDWSNLRLKFKLATAAGRDLEYR